MLSAFQTFGKLGAIGKAIASAWSPLSLWPDGAASPGMWIDPSLLTASFNDYLGTTPVATPGTVADSANPVGLALDIRGGLAAGAVVFTENFASAGLWSLGTGATISGGSLNLSSTPNQTGAFLLNPPGMSAGKYYEITFEITSISSGAVSVSYGYSPGLSNPKTSAGIYTVQCFSADTYIRVYAVGTTTAVIDNISIREIPGNHMLQATSAARPLESARVNLLTKTEDLTVLPWEVRGGAVVTANQGPTGYTDLDSIVNATGGLDKGVAANSSVIASGQVCTVQAVLAAVSGTTTANLRCLNAASGGDIQVVLTTTPQIVSLTATVDNSGAAIGIAISPYVNGEAILAGRAQLNLGSTALPYQRVNTASDYTATGVTPFQLYDGTDDGMATATFAAGTLIDGMDCMIAVRRDSTARVIIGPYTAPADATKFFGVAENGSGATCVGSGAGTPTVWVDGTQLTGGTAVTRGTLHTALTPGAWHILELRGLDLSTWTAICYGRWDGSYAVNGARGDIMLYPSTASTTDKDNARQYLADLYGVTLP